MQWILLLSLLYLGTRPSTAQFVFFGPQFGGFQNPPSRPQQAPLAPLAQPQPQRFGAGRPAPAPVQPAAPALTAERFSETFFRPSKKLNHPKKNALPEEKPEDVQFVQILTEKPEVNPSVESSRSSGASRENSVVLPAQTVTKATTARPSPTTTQRTTTARPTTTTKRTTTARPTTTTKRTTTARPTTTTKRTTTARPTTTTTAKPTARPTPLQIKSFVVNQFGQAVSRPRTTAAPVVRTTAAPRTARPTQESRRPKAVSEPRPKGNYQWEGKSYLLTWRNHRNNFDWRGGVQYCKSQGMKLISLDSKEKSEHFLRLVATDRAPYFWAGGQISRNSRTLTWQNGKTESIARGQHPWSFTGRTGPQPDGGEICLAILNSVYRDGVKYHDVACHHRKPVICEE